MTKKLSCAGQRGVGDPINHRVYSGNLRFSLIRTSVFWSRNFRVQTEKVFVFSRPAIFLLQIFFRVKVCVSSFHFLPFWKFRWPEKFSIEQTLPHGTKILVSRPETAFFATQLTHSGFQNRFSRKVRKKK